MAKQIAEMLIESVNMELPDTKTLRLKWPEGYDVDFKTGQRKWEDLETIGPGSVTAADGMMIVLSQDDSKVSLVEMTPAGIKVAGEFVLPMISKLRKPEAKAFTHPVVAGGKLYVREQEMLFCYELK